MDSLIFITTGLVAYLTLVAVLRKQRLRSTLRSFPYENSQSFASMTLEHASEIQNILYELEFPFTFHKGLQFALFRTYGIPSISKLLNETRQLSDPATACKRYVDTEVLVAEFCQNHPQSERAVEAIARMNFIHSLYQKSGKISNEDLLYTLSLFALEPMRWIDRFEWRQLEDFEKNALGTFWKAMGDAMEIDYRGHLSKGATGWEHGMQWLQDVEEWAEKYEASAMVPDINNHQVAEETTAILLWYIPNWAKDFGKTMVCTLMDDRLRTAMLYDRPSQLYYGLSTFVFNTRKVLLRLFALPRPAFLAKRNTTEKPDSRGRYHMTIIDAAPYYVKPTYWNRFGPFSWFARLLQRPLPGDKASQFWPHGFQTQEIGPEIVKGKGQRFMDESTQRIVRMRTHACPFAGSTA